MSETRQDSSFRGFQEISYLNQKQINYLADTEGKGPEYIRFLESMNFSETDNKEHSHFDSIANELEKKILKQGYLDKPSKVSKKSKKGDSDVNYYNSSDNFINDEECCIQKKDKQSSLSDFEAIPLNSIEELYSHPLYIKKEEDLIVDMGKRKAPHPILSEEGYLTKFDEIKKKIKLSLLNRQNQEGEEQIPLQKKEEEGSDGKKEQRDGIQVIDLDGKSQEEAVSGQKQKE